MTSAINGKSLIMPKPKKNYVLGDFDVWYERCENCGYDTGKSRKLDDPRCWKCGRPIKRDLSSRALKPSVREKSHDESTN